MFNLDTCGWLAPPFPLGAIPHRASPRRRRSVLRAMLPAVFLGACCRFSLRSMASMVSRTKVDLEDIRIMVARRLHKPDAHQRVDGPIGSRGSSITAYADDSDQIESELRYVRNVFGFARLPEGGMNMA